MKLTAFKYGTTLLPERMAFINGDENVKLPIGLLFFLIEHENRKILVDVGCYSMSGFEILQFEDPVKVLESYGIKRTEITDAIITHSHTDHIAAVFNYPQAVVHIHMEELKAAEKHLKDIKTIRPFNGNKNILENVEIKHIGGHSKGSCVVLINTNQQTYVLCGDECYTKENLIKNLPTACSVSPEKSRKFVEEYRKEKYIPVLFHDPDIVPEIGFRVLYEG